MIEELILSSLVYNDDYTRKVLPYLKRDYFRNLGYQVVFSLIREHYLKYNKAPTPEIIGVRLEDMGLKENVYEEAAKVVAGIENKGTDTEWLIDSTEEFCKKQAFYNAVMAAADLLEKDDVRNFGKASALMDEANAVQFDERIGLDYMEDVEERLKKYKEKLDQLPCNLSMFNKVTKGGFVDKSMTIFVAPTGVGKSMCMCHFASSFLLEGRNVLYITLEMSETRITERIDANLLDVELDRLKELDTNGFFARMKRLKSKTNGRLIVKEYPAKSVHAGHFRHLIHELKLKKNFKPDAIFVDYLGICLPEKTGAKASMYEIGSAISVELRALAQEFGCRLFTAVQVNREGSKNVDFDLTDVAESYAVTHTADYAYAIVQTEELAKMNKLKIKRIKDRYADIIDWYPSFVVGVDKKKQRLFDVDTKDKNEEDEDFPVFDRSDIGKFIEAGR